MNYLGFKKTCNLWEKETSVRDRPLFSHFASSKTNKTKTPKWCIVLILHKHFFFCLEEKSTIFHFSTSRNSKCNFCCFILQININQTVNMHSGVCVCVSAQSACVVLCLPPWRAKDLISSAGLITQQMGQSAVSQRQKQTHSWIMAGCVSLSTWTEQLWLDS